MADFINMTVERSSVQLTISDFEIDQMVKWCPGCGAHAILMQWGTCLPEDRLPERELLVLFPALVVHPVSRIM